VAQEKLSTHKVKAAYEAFSKEFEPTELFTKDGSVRPDSALFVLVDERTGANYCDCHIRANKLINGGTTDAPLDPDQMDYRANRELVVSASAFQTMKDDAKRRRSFSNIVAEYTKEYDPDHPLKIIGGQHRFQAIREALSLGVDEIHGVKVYLGLDKEQRLDVQLTSNTNIAISGDLFDRMHETVRGPELREWCQSVGFLASEEDFSDSYQRGGRMSVQIVRTFIVNYFLGKTIDLKKFESIDTTPILCARGQHDDAWQRLRQENPNLLTDSGLREAAKEFARLIEAQRSAFAGRKPKPPADYPEKAMNLAVLSAWAYVGGALHANDVRLKRHYGLTATAGRDPMNAAARAKGRHKSDPENYRGLGYRTEARERGRLVELFHLQAEKGGGLVPGLIDAAIKQLYAKQASLEASKAVAKVANAG
jgi:hypothetical protein